MRCCLAVLALSLTACQVPTRTPPPDGAVFRPTTADLKDVAKAAAAAPKPVLVVLDIDDTLLATVKSGTEHAFYGSDRWYRWQYALPPHDADKVPCLLPHALYWNSQVVPLEAVQSDAPEIVNGLPMDRLILTSRGSAQRPGTERALIGARYALGTPLPGVNATTMPGAHGDMTYEQGILMTGGTPKGVAITKLLENRSSTHYRSIVMADDDSGNLISVRDALKQSALLQPVEFIGLRYTRIKDEPLTAPTEEMKQSAHAAWIVWREWLRKYERGAAEDLESAECMQ